MRGMASGVLVLEAVVLFLTTPVMVQVADVRPAVAVPVGVGLALAAVLTCGLLGRPAGLVVGSVLQVVAIGLGFVVPAMFVLGAIFAALWVTAVVLGRRVDAIKARRAAAGPQ